MRPVRLEALLADELQGEFVQVRAKVLPSGPYFDYDYTLTEPQEIEALLAYLKGISVRRRIYTPKPGCRTELYSLTLTRTDGTHLSLALDDNLFYAGRHYTVVKPKGWEQLHELVAGSPAWWHQ